jgi:hypothetical protein
MLVFMDESGNHNLNYLNVSDPYSVFVLGAVIFEDDEYEKFDRAFKSFKYELFGTDDLILHTKEITRPSVSKNQLNLRFNNPEFRESFYSKLDNLIEQYNFKVVVSIIQKLEFKEKEGLDSKDPYLYSFYSLMDKIMFHCRGQITKVYPEKRNYQDDIKLKAEFLGIQAGGTKRFKGSTVNETIDEFTLKDKSVNISGMQLIDLLVTPIGRHFIGKPAKPYGNEINYEKIKAKLNDKDYFIYP